MNILITSVSPFHPVLFEAIFQCVRAWLRGQYRSTEYRSTEVQYNVEEQSFYLKSDDDPSDQ